MNEDLADQDVLWSVRVAGAKGEEGRRRAQLVEILVAAINERQTKRSKSFPTPTEYYVAALSTLATQLSSNATDAPIALGDVLYILSKVIPHIPTGVARLDSDAAFASIFAATGKCSNLGARSGLACLAGLLNMQAKETWGRPIVVKSFRACLSKVVDDNPKVRRAAQEAVVEVVSKSSAPSQALQMALEAMKSILGSAGTSERNLLKFLYFARMVAPNFQTVAKLHLEAMETIMSLIESSTQSDVITEALKTLKEYVRTRVTAESGSKDEYVMKLVERLIKCFKFSRFPLQAWAETLAFISTHSGSHDIACKAILGVLREQPVGETDLERLSEYLTTILVSSQISKPEAIGIVEAFINYGLQPQSQGIWHWTLTSFAVLVETNLNHDDDLPLLRQIASKAVASRESLVDWKTGEEKTDAPWKKPMEQLISACAGVMGPDSFLQAISLAISKQDQNLNPARMCLLKSMKDAWRNPSNDLVRLATFRRTILTLAKFCEDSASTAEANGMPQNAKMFHTRTVQLWSLLPAFCSGASDVSESFPPMAKMLAHALQDTKSPELGPIVAQSITSLVRSIVGFSVFDCTNDSDVDMLLSRYGGTFRSKKSIKGPRSLASGLTDENNEDEEDEEEDEEEEEEEALRIKGGTKAEGVEIQRRIRSEEEQQQDLLIVRKFAPNFLPLLFNEYDSAYRSDQGGIRTQSIFAAIEALCRIADPKYLSTLFRQLVQKLLTAVNNDDYITAKVLLAIASALIPGLGDDEATMLLRVLKPHIAENNEESADEGMQKRAFVCLMRLLKAPNLKDFVIRKREELIDYLQQSLSVEVKSSVKCTRLQCLRQLLSDQGAGVEVRDLSAELMGEVLLSMKEVNSQTREAAFALFSDMAERMDNSENHLQDFFQMTVAGLAATTPHMRSCTILAISRLIAMFGSRVDCSELCAQAALACLDLFTEKSREIARSLITLCKVCAIKLEASVLTAKVLPSLLTGILPWSLDTKNRFSLKIRVVFDKLVKRIGLEAVLHPGIIPEDHRLLAYIKRQQSMKRNRREGKVSESGKDSSRRRRNDGDHAEDDIEITQSGADPINLLDPSSLGNMKKRRKTDDEDDEKDDFERDDEGRIIIPEDEDDRRAREGKSKKRSRPESDGEEDEEDDDVDTEEVNASKGTDKRKKKKKAAQQFGQEFKAKKAGGDAKYKGMKMDPYAYIPLDHRMLNKRKKHQAVKRFVGVGRGSRKGYRNRSSSKV